MGKLRQAELIRRVADSTGNTQTNVKNVLVEASKVIKAQTGRGKSVVFPGLGFFMAVNRRARMGRNPRTMEPFEVPPRRALVFRVSGKVTLDSE